MKSFIILFAIAAIAAAQRPTYAGLTPKGYPELASRFRDPADDQDIIANTNSIANRIGEDDTQLPPNLPTDARGDVVLVNRLNSWPQENRPFWLINAQHIEQHRRPNGNFIQQQQNLNTLQQPVWDQQQNLGQTQSRFGGRKLVATEIRTIRPPSQRGSFAGYRS